MTLALALHLTTERAGAQNLSLFVAPSATSIEVSNSVTYTIDVTNLTTVAQNIWVTNTFSGALPASFTAYYYTSGSETNTTNSITFSLGTIGVNSYEQVTLTVEPLVLGNLTNAIVLFGEGVTNTTLSTNIVVQVTTTNQSDLGVTMSGFPSIAYTNDWVTYDLDVTNAGPAAATDVILTNNFPTNGVELISVSPTNQVYQTVASNLIFNLGTVAAGGVANLQITVMPTNAGVFAFSAFVGTTNQLDLDTNSSSFTTNLTVTNFIPATFATSLTSGQTFDHLTGREEQVITLMNTGGSPIPSARVIVTGLTPTNWLSNAVGTNNGNPYVVYGTSLGAGDSVNLTLQFYPAFTPFTFTTSQLAPVAIYQPDLTLPATGITSSNLNIVLVTNISGEYLVEFKAITNRLYAISYNDNLATTNWLAAQPPFFVSANYGLWIDYGPPETISNAPSSRMYRVYMYPQTP